MGEIWISLAINGLVIVVVAAIVKKYMDTIVFGRDLNSMNVTFRNLNTSLEKHTQDCYEKRILPLEGEISSMKNIIERMEKGFFRMEKRLMRLEVMISLLISKNGLDNEFPDSDNDNGER